MPGARAKVKVSGFSLIRNGVRFDYPFLAAHFARHGLPRIENDLLDTLDLARSTLHLPSYALGSVAQHFQISTVGAHRAAADVAMTRQVLFKLCES